MDNEQPELFRRPLVAVRVAERQTVVLLSTITRGKLTRFSRSCHYVLTLYCTYFGEPKYNDIVEEMDYIECISASV
jgi:hypothetical protein